MNGDSFLIETKKNNILVDGGYVSTYNKYIRPRLDMLKNNGKKLDYLIVTHIDEDHISGVIKLIEENKEGQIIEIGDVWHNSYAHVAELKDGLVFKGKPLKTLPINYSLKDGITVTEKDISAVQGSTLASLLLRYKIPSNKNFNGNRISVDTTKRICSNDVCFNILSPSKEKLLDLKTYWKKELYKKGYSSDADLTDFNEDAFEFILSLEREKKKLLKKNVSTSIVPDIAKLSVEGFLEDNTATNGSSIAFVLEHNGFRILLLGDSHPSQVVEGLKLHYPQEKLPIKFNLIKVSHHGSKNNTSPELLEYIDSENFVFSTNGLSHGHPDGQTIARIVHRPVDFKRKLYFNYTLASNIPCREASMGEKYNYEIVESLDGAPTEFIF